MMKATAGAGALAMGVGSGIVGSASGALTGFDDLSVSANNRIVNESDETFKMRGLNIPDPKRLDKTTAVRGKTAEQIVGMLTNNEEDWHPRVLRVPAQPADIGEHPNGHAGPEYFDENGDLNPDAPDLENPDAIRESRRAMQPAQPVAFGQQQLDDYLEDYYKPIVDLCRERGVYCIIDFHRHWHEQPPGTEDPSAAENHLPYDSDHTNYWAYNTHDMFGDDVPGSWGHVDQTTIEELGNGTYVPGLNSVSDLAGTPYAEDMWQVNEELLEEAQMFWDAAAEMFADEPHVIFETYNEPTAPGIWGPVSDCGALKQKPLWSTFLNDFIDPIVDTIRQHAADDLLMIGPMGWCQSVQGLHWENFREHGIDNAAVTWHNYAGHDVSQVDYWMNDTDYESLGDVEAETGKQLEDPFLAPPDPSTVDNPACWGWEGFQAAGLQNAMDHAPVAVTEFGWIDDPSASHWLRGSTTGQGTTFEYGEPFFEAMESDDRISWVAWCADPRWLPAMFDVDWTIDEGELDLVNDNWYHPDTTIPTKCENLPCDWELMGNPNSGEYIKEQLADNKDNFVPFDTEVLGPIDDTTTPEPEGPMDPDNDELYEDFNGDGETNLADAGDLFQERNSDHVQNNVEMYDFSGNDEIDLADVVELFKENTN